MKLYLSSYQFGNEIHALKEMVGTNTKVGIIQNALDVYSDIERRKASLQREIDGLSNIGLQPEELDLRSYYSNKEKLAGKLSRLGGVWVTGGNCFALRGAFKESGMDEWLIQQRNNNEFVYSGYSAGVCVLAPNLKGIDLMDDPEAAQKLFNKDVVWEGLGLVSYLIVPHFDSPSHKASPLTPAVVEFMKKEGLPYKTLRDGEVIIENTSNVETTQEMQNRLNKETGQS